MSHIGMEIDDSLRSKLRIHLATLNVSVRDYITNLILKDLEEYEKQSNEVKEK